jgi:hypothetical protein
VAEIKTSLLEKIATKQLSMVGEQADGSGGMEEQSGKLFVRRHSCRIFQHKRHKCRSTRLFIQVGRAQDGLYENIPESEVGDFGFRGILNEQNRF